MTVRRLEKEAVLEMCASLAREGQKNPLNCLSDAAAVTEYENVDHAGAMLAVMREAGGSLVKWYGVDGSHRQLSDTVALFDDALFAAQIG